jgi:hypothetical protein
LWYNLPVIPAGGLKEDPNMASITKAFKAIVLLMFIETKGGFNPAAGLNQNRGLGVGTQGRPVGVNPTNPRSDETHGLMYLEETKSCYYY